jgi:hypothetical protein
MTPSSFPRSGASNQPRAIQTTSVDEHHGWARYGWVLDDPAGAPVLTGTDVVRVDGDGRLAQLVGFFGELAPVEG